MALTPPKRTTVLRAVWNKIQTQLQKPQNAEAKKAIDGIRCTKDERQNQVLWDPSEAAVKALLAMMENELQFIRDRQEQSRKDMTAEIEKLKRYLAVHFPTPASSAEAPST